MREFPSDLNKTLIALSPIFLPNQDNLDFRPQYEGLSKRCFHFMKQFSTLGRLAFFWTLRFFEWFPFLFGFGLSRFSSLSQSLQEKYVDQWFHSRFLARREFMKGVKSLIMIHLLSDPAVWDYIECQPEVHIKERIKMRQAYLQKEKERDVS